MRLWKSGANGVLEMTRLGGLYRRSTMGPSATALEEWRDIAVPCSYFCRAARFRSILFFKEARGRITMLASATPLEEWRNIEVAFCSAGHF